jgi:hypothetical protein
MIAPQPKMFARRSVRFTTAFTRSPMRTTFDLYKCFVSRTTLQQLNNFF